jgi:hypothetical protein
VTFSVFSPSGRLLASARAAEKPLSSAEVGAAAVLGVAAEAVRAERIETTLLIKDSDRRRWGPT